MVKNLVFVRQFTIDNSVIVTFDPFGFTLEGFESGAFIRSCDNTGDLYHVLPLSNASLPTTNLTSMTLPT